MNYTLNINYIINNVIFTIDEHYKEKIIPQTLKNYLYLIATGMIINYGDSYIKDIYNTIFMTNYYLSVPYNNHLKYNNPTSHNYLEKEISFIKYQKTYKYNLLYKEIDNSPIKTLEYLTYQLNYILFNHQKKISLNNIKLHLSSLKPNFIMRKEKDNNIISDVFNAIQTEEIIKIILNLQSNSIKNKVFTDILTSFKNIDIKTYQLEGLDILANLFKPLYKKDKLKNLIDSYNNTELIKKELDNVLGKNTYKNTYCQLLLINNILSSNDTTNYYELSNYYINIRNNIINKYITSKWA